MNRFSKARQCRPKITEPKPEPKKVWKRIAPISKKHRKVLAMDAICADEALSRDSYECVAHRELWHPKEPVTATVVHHLQGKNTHFGIERRFQMLFLVSLCNECHADTESQNGHSRWLDIEAREDSETMGTQLFRQTIDGVRKEAERPNVSNWNPFEIEE